jgi:hypothetical protein
MATRSVEALAAPLYLGSGANRVKVNTDGTVTLEGDATAWKDITGDVGSWSLDGNPGKADFDTTERLIVLEPSGSLATEADVVCVQFQLQHDMKVDTALKVHLHWQQPNATIQFKWKYRILENGAAFSSSWSSDVTVNATGAANAFAYASGTLNQITILGDIATTDIGLSSIIQVKLARTDATAGNVFIYDLDAHYEVDAFGSKEEYTK